MDDSEQWSVENLRTIVDRRLRVLVPSAQVSPQRLHQAMVYSLLAPAKRLRPVLTLLTSVHFGVRDLRALDSACAVEMIHAASLVFDDLPAMDNAELRRGQPTSHRQFGEDIAILSGIALLNQAFGVIASAEGLSDATRVELARVFSAAVGSNGLVGGQVFDLKERSNAMDQRQLEKLNQLKTAALFVASVEAGALVSGATESELEAAREFATELGLAFQIADDLIDDPAYAGKTGKDTGKDVGKPTLPSLLGTTGARDLLSAHLNRARQHLNRMGPAESPLSRFFETTFAAFRS